MRDSNDRLLAKLLLQGLITPEKAAEHFQLNDPLKSKFIQNTHQAVVDCMLDDSLLEKNTLLVSAQITAIKSTSFEDGREIQTIAELAADAARKLEGDSADIFEELDPIITPSILLASSMIDILRGNKSLGDPDVLAEVSSSTLTKAHLIAENTELEGLSAVSAVVGIGIEACCGLIEEYQYQKNNEKIEQKLMETVKQAEEAYFMLHQMYAKVSEYYQRSLAELRKQSPVDQIKCQNRFKEWVEAQQYVVDQIKEHQKKIATVGAMCQQLQSQRRLGRVNNVLSGVIAATAFIGPPGLIASTLIKAVTFAGVSLAEGSISTNSELNHGVVRDNNGILMVSDPSSIDDAERHVAHTATPVIALSGPELRPTALGGIHVDRMLYTDRGLIEKMLEKTIGRTSCSFCFAEPLPKLPEVNRNPVETNFTRKEDGQLKKQGKEQLQELIAVANALNDQADYLNRLGHELMKKYPSNHPYVINFNELVQALKNSYEAIQERRAVIIKNMGADYLARRTNGKLPEGVKLLNQLESSSNLFETNAKLLADTAVALENTHHAVLFKNGVPISFQHMTVEESEFARQHMIESYGQDPIARQAWLKDIEFNLTAIDKISLQCEKLEKGRHITNLGEALFDIEAQLVVLNRILDDPNSKNITEMERQHIKNFSDKLNALYARSLLLDQKRINYLAENPSHLTGTPKQYNELCQLEECLVTYTDHMEDFHLTDDHHKPMGISMNAYDHIEAMKHLLTSEVELELVQPTPVVLNMLDKTDAFVSANRNFFGSDKHVEMQAAVEKKNNALNDQYFEPAIQIMPLRPIDEMLLASLRGNPEALEGVIEGLKTEIQWFEKFSEECTSKGVTIINFDELTKYYQHQLNALEIICQNKDKALGKASDMIRNPRDVVSLLADKVHHVVNESVRHGSEKELAKAKNVLERIFRTRQGILHLPDEHPPSTPKAKVASESYKERLRSLQKSSVTKSTESPVVTTESTRKSL